MTVFFQTTYEILALKVLSHQRVAKAKASVHKYHSLHCGHIQRMDEAEDSDHKFRLLAMLDTSNMDITTFSA